MRFQQDGAARRFIATPSLHTNIPILNDINSADAITAAHLVQKRQQLRRRLRLPIHRNRIAALVGQFEIGRRIRCRLWRHGPKPHRFFRLRTGIF